MTLTQETLQQALAPRPVRFYAQAGSTNDIALDWLRDGVPDGAVVIADEQVKGRGRLGRSWYAPPGSAVMLSVILRPGAELLPRVGMMGAQAICDLLDGLGMSDVSIKWPNDVRIRGRKVSGVLPEAAWDGNQLAGVVLGMGINVRIDFEGTVFSDSATSIEPELDRRVNRLELVTRLLGRIDYWSQHLGSDQLYTGWKRRLETPGQRVTVKGLQGDVQGLAETVDEQGALLVRTDDGSLHRIVAGDIGLGEQG